MNSSKGKEAQLEHMYRRKSTEGKETLKTSQIDAPDKKSLKNRHIKSILKKVTSSNLLNFSLTLLFQCDHNHHSNLTSY